MLQKLKMQNLLTFSGTLQKGWSKAGTSKLVQGKTSVSPEDPFENIEVTFRRYYVADIVEYFSQLLFAFLFRYGSLTSFSSYFWAREMIKRKTLMNPWLWLNKIQKWKFKKSTSYVIHRIKLP